MDHPPRRSRSRREWLDLACLLLAVVFVGLFLATWAQFYLAGGASNIGVDFSLYHDATVRWLGGGSFYGEYQLQGPYPITHGDVLYPPPVLVLLVPFVFLPAALWWILPITVTAVVLAWHRPRPWAWLLISLCLVYPITGVRIWHGNPGLWVTAAIALGTRYAWPSALVLLKPTLAPFALIGANRRTWWIALAGLAAVSLAFLPMWPDFIRAVLNSRSDAGLLYSLNEIPQDLIPVIAWVGGVRSHRLRPVQPSPPPITT